MIRWCAYCQSFLGEREPFEDLGFTHGVCGDCLPLFDPDTEADFDAIELLKRFHDELREAGVRGDRDAALALITRAQSQGLKTSDVLLGLMGPILYEVGALWEAKRITVADEHRFTRFYRAILAALAEAGIMPRDDSVGEDLDVLLIQPRGNAHVLGLELLVHWLRDHHVKVAQVRADCSPPLEAVIALRRPRLVGISMALPKQLSEVDAIVARVSLASAGKAQIYVGGQAVKAGLVSVPPPAVALVDPMAFLDLIRNPSTAAPAM